MSNGFASNARTIDVQSEARGSHWVAWVPRNEDGKPLHSVLLIGPTRKEAEERARRWGVRVT